MRAHLGSNRGLPSSEVSVTLSILHAKLSMSSIRKQSRDCFDVAVEIWCVKRTVSMALQCRDQQVTIANAALDPLRRQWCPNGTSSYVFQCRHGWFCILNN